jgi:hypothetical protein
VGAGYTALAMRLILALRCFFLILFARRLPTDAIALLPPAPEPEAPKLPPGPSPEEQAREKEAHAQAIESARRDGMERGAFLLLGLLQREGRLIDFLEEDLTGYPDAKVGAAARDIHKGCKKVLAEHVPVAPVLPEADNATVKIEPGFDPGRIRLVGNVVGQPPFTGTLRHPGWRGKDGVKLPSLGGSQDASVIAPAEVELP